MMDRFTRGFAAGAVVGMLVDLLSLLTYNLFGFTQWRFIDFAGLIILGRRPAGAGEIIVSVLGQVGFSAAVGIIFAYLLPLTTSRNYMLKGWFFGVMILFSIYSTFHLFQIPQLLQLDLGTVITNMVKASLFGLGLAWLLARLDSNTPV